MFKKWITNAIFAAMLTVTIALGGYAVKSSLEVSSLRSEVVILSDDLAKSRVAVDTLTASVKVMKDDNEKLQDSIDGYVIRLNDDNEKISQLKWSLENVQDKETHKCFNQVTVPESVLSGLYPEG